MIVYILMKFPVPSETFAASDILALKRSGEDVKTLCLKSNRMSDLFLAFTLGLLYPIKLLTLLFSGLLDFKSALLVPNALLCWYRIHQLQPKQVHLFWGHYPSLVGFLVKKFSPHINVSLFLGAYDLELDLKISRWMIQHTDHLITHSKANTVQLIKMGANADQIHIIHRGIDVAGLKESLPDIVKKPHSWVSAGRLLKTKGFDLVIKSFANYQSLYPEAVLTIIGDGPERGPLEALARELGLAAKIQFTGHLAHKEVLKQMALHAYFVFLSSKPGERLPNVLKEAMLAGCLCLSSFTPGVDELIEDGVDGLIMRTQLPLSAADFEALLANKDQIKMAQKAREKIETDFNADLQMNEYRKLWGVSQNAHSGL